MPGYCAREVIRHIDYIINEDNSPSSRLNYSVYSSGPVRHLQFLWRPGTFLQKTSRKLYYHCNRSNGSSSSGDYHICNHNCSFHDSRLYYRHLRPLLPPLPLLLLEKMLPLDLLKVQREILFSTKPRQGMII